MNYYFKHIPGYLHNCLYFSRLSLSISSPASRGEYRKSGHSTTQIDLREEARSAKNNWVNIPSGFWTYKYGLSALTVTLQAFPSESRFGPPMSPRINYLSIPMRQSFTCHLEMQGWQWWRMRQLLRNKINSIWRPCSPDLFLGQHLLASLLDLHKPCNKSWPPFYIRLRKSIFRT